MSKKEILTNRSLTLEISDNNSDGAINIIWKGRSTDPEPGNFITPILSKTFNDALADNKKVIMDFTNLEYLNSSTITPISKFLEKAKNEGHSVVLLYDKTTKWQELSFSALKIFETDDSRIKVNGN